MLVTAPKTTRANAKSTHFSCIWNKVTPTMLLKPFAVQTEGRLCLLNGKILLSLIKLF